MKLQYRHMLTKDICIGYIITASYHSTSLWIKMTMQPLKSQWTRYNLSQKKKNPKKQSVFLVRHLEYVKINTEVQYQQVTVGPLSAESDASVSCQSVRVHLDPFVQAAGQHYPTDLQTGHSNSYSPNDQQMICQKVLQFRYATTLHLVDIRGVISFSTKRGDSLTTTVRHQSAFCLLWWNVGT